MKPLSLFDTAEKRIVDVWLAFYDLPDRKNVLWKLLKPGFSHVEVWKYNGIFWLRMNPYLEFAEVTADVGPPWTSLSSLNPTMLQVRRALPAGKVHTPFSLGPVTCVELAKAFIGMSDMLVRTPYQLYRRLKT